jgi:hypothetical protein
MKTLDYYVIVETNLNRLHDKVNNMLAKGYTVTGGVAVMRDTDNTTYYYQAVILQSEG